MRKREQLHLTEVKINNYKTLRDVSISLEPLNVLIGANGSGKTSLLELFDILSVGMSNNLKNAIFSKGGLVGLRSHGININEPLSIELIAGRYRYIIKLKAVNQSYIVEMEQLKIDGKLLIDRTATKANYRKNSKLIPAKKADGFDEAELLLAQAPRWNMKEIDEFRDYLGSLADFVTFYAGLGSNIRLPQMLEPGWLMPAIDGSKLIPALYNIKSNHKDTYNRIEEALRSAFSEFKELDFRIVSLGQASLVWRENGGLEFFHNQLSEGTLRFLCLVTLLLSPNLPALVMIDEPEISMHPEMLMIIAGLLQEASKRSTIFVATHSDRLIKWLEPHELLVLNKEKGFSTLQRADDPKLNIQEWLKTYTLDQLWLMGELGGRS